MNKHIFYIAAACAALASCVKNEVKVDAPDKEITFQTVSTKAGAAFEKDKHFFSYAYFLEKDKTWDPDFASAKPYIDKAVITYEPGTAAGKGYWAAGDTYYWPKQGSLTFFAWTDNTIHHPTSNPAPSVGTGATVSCTPNTGIKIENYSVMDNLNKDILVAEIAKNKIANGSATGDWKEGVPTVFRHALAKVEFKVNKKEAYPNVTFKVKKITLTKVSTRGTFTQCQSTPNENWGWNGWGLQEDLPVFTSAAGKEVTKTADSTPEEFDALTPDPNTDYHIVLPQVLRDKIDPTITIEYEIITSYVTGNPVTEKVIETKDLKDIYKSDWECNKKYVLGITLGLNEIYWDPSVEGWENGDVTNIL